jgi:hypothetical protein
MAKVGKSTKHRGRRKLGKKKRRVRSARYKKSRK